MPRQYDLTSKRGKMMLEDPIHKLIPRMAGPSIVAQLITVIYNLVDTMFVSSIGTNATAAVGVNASLEQVINLAGTLLAVGTASIMSRMLGAKRGDKANQVFSTAFFTGIGFACLVMLIGLPNIRWLVKVLGATDECFQYTIDYATYVLWAAPFMITTLIMNTCLRSEGGAMLAMLGTGFGGILNCILDPIFIFTFDLGVSGASMATAISKVVSCSILLYPYITRHTIVKLSIKNVSYNIKDCFEVLSISSAFFFRALLQVISATLMNHVAGAFSTSVLAAVSVGTKVMRFPFAIIMGFSQGYQPVVGFNWGAKSFDRVRKSFSFSLKVSIIGACVMGGLLGIFASPVAQLFSRNDDELIRIAALFIRFECITMPIHAAVAIINMFYGGIVRALEGLIISTARQGYCMIPLLFILPRIFGTMGITYCQPAGDLLSLLIAIPLGIRAVRLISLEEKKLKES